jgi:ABC-type transport system substrate-binding protein
MDDLVAAAKIEIDFEKRKKLYKDLAQIMLEQGTFHVMYQPDELLARRSYVKDFIFGTFWFSPLLNYAYKE